MKRRSLPRRAADTHSAYASSKPHGGSGCSMCSARARGATGIGRRRPRRSQDRGGPRSRL